MAQRKSSSEELESLRREVAELRAERNAGRAPAKSAAKRTRTTPVKTTVPEPEPPAADAAEEGWKPEWEKTVRDLTAHVESAVKDIEDATRERPVLTLLATFTSGIVIGHLLGLVRRK